MSQVRNISSLLRPLTARSVVASTLLGMDPPALSAAALVASGEVFGVAAGTTRVALSRMVDVGELALDDGVYSLAGSLLERYARQEQGRHPKTTRWTGQWRMAIVTEASRSATDRAALRTAMAQMRMAEWREGVWVRPHNLPPTRSSVVDAQCAWINATPDDDIDVDALFATGEWAATARSLLRSLADTVGGLRARDASALADTFVIAAATTRHLTLDPLLPGQLLPRDWPGPELRDAYDDYQDNFAATLRDWYRSTIG